MRAGQREVFQPVLSDPEDQRRQRRIDACWLPISFALLLLLIPVAVTIFNHAVEIAPRINRTFTEFKIEHPFPVVHIASWVLILLCSAPLLSTILMWRLVDTRHVRRLMSTQVLATFFAGVSMGFAYTYPEPSGITFRGDLLGWHWLGGVLALLGALAALVRRSTLPSAPDPIPHKYEQEEAWLRARAERDAWARERLSVDLENLQWRRTLADAEAEELAAVYPAFEAKLKAKRWWDFSGANQAGKEVADEWFRLQQRHVKAQTERDRVARLAQVGRSPDEPAPRRFGSLLRRRRR